MKKTVSVFLAALLILFSASSAFAAGFQNESMLKFHDDGTFTLVNLCDLQDVHPMNRTTHQFVQEMLADVKPDLVVLGGDNCVADHDSIPDGIREICDLFVEADVCFTLVFGNHDHQQGYTNDELFAFYKEFGGEYCLAYDAVPELTGCGTHNLPIMSSDGSKVAFNLYMFDSNAYTVENGVELGYDCVHPDQIQWYRDTAAALKAQNGGEVVPAMAFQHIIVQDACDALFFRAPRDLGSVTNSFDGVSYTYIPKIGGIKDGYLLEFPCPGYHNYGQLDAMAETGDVIAIFSGHDHVNNFTVNVKGIDVINTAGCTYHSYGNVINRGCRVIELNENNPRSFETYTRTVAEQAMKNGSHIPEFGDMSRTKALFTVLFEKGFSVFFRFVKFLFFYAK